MRLHHVVTVSLPAALVLAGLATAPPSAGQGATSSLSDPSPHCYEWDLEGAYDPVPLEVVVRELADHGAIHPVAELPAEILDEAPDVIAEEIASVREEQDDWLISPEPGTAAAPAVIVSPAGDVTFIEPCGEQYWNPLVDELAAEQAETGASLTEVEVLEGIAAGSITAEASPPGGEWTELQPDERALSAPETPEEVMSELRQVRLEILVPLSWRELPLSFCVLTSEGWSDWSSFSAAPPAVGLEYDVLLPATGDAELFACDPHSLLEDLQPIGPLLSLDSAGLSETDVVLLDGAPDVRSIDELRELVRRGPVLQVSGTRPFESGPRGLATWLSGR